MAGEKAYFMAASDNLVTGVTITASADALYPVANLYDDRPSKPFKWAAAGADDSITMDLGSATDVDFCSIHGHNLDAGVTAVQLRYSSDNFSADDNLASAMTKASPSFYVILSAAQSARYWRVKFAGTNGNPIEIGELVLGDITQFTVAHRSPYEISYRYPQIRNVSRAGEVHAYSLTTDPVRTVQLSYRPDTAAKFEQCRDDIFVATKGGATPLVLVPDNSREEVFFGHIDNSWETTKMFKNLWEHSLTLTELPMRVSVT